jgi:hypothetical protein
MERAMKKPPGIIIAAVLLILLAVIGTIGTVGLVVVSAITPHPAINGRQMQVIEGVLAAFFALSAILKWCVGVGLFRGKNWARIGGVVLGALMALSYACFALGILAMMTMPQFRSQLANTHFALILCVLFYLLMTAFGLWLAIYLSLKSVRQAFHSDVAYVPPSVAYPSNAALDAATAPAFPASVAYSETSPTSAQFNAGLKLPRIVVLVLAALNLVGALSLLTMAAAGFPLVFPGISLQGHAAALAMVVIATINVVIAIGLFRRFPPAYYVALAMQALGVVSSLALLSPSFRARTIQASMVIAARMTPVQPPQMQSAQMQSAQMQSMMHSIQNGALLFNAIFVPFLLAFFIWAILRDLASVRGNTAAR